jgi:GMP synthase (glutamine-hydrolysing)
MRIGILETGDVAESLRVPHEDYTKMFGHLLDGHGFEFVAYRTYLGELPDSPGDCDGWLITGSRHGVYDDLPWIAPLEEFVRAVYAAKIPLVGICFGHQIMAQALGGKVVKSDKGWGAGVQRYRSAETGGEIAVLASHQDQVVEKPADAKVIASSEFCEFAGLAYDGPALSYQPHPEFSKEYMAGIFGMRRGESYSHEFAEARLAELDAALDSDWMGKRIARFFLEHQPK